MNHVTFVLLALYVLFSSLVMAIWIPNGALPFPSQWHFAVEFILGLTGSLIGSTVTIIVPSAMYLSVSSKHASRLIELAAKVLSAACRDEKGVLQTAYSVQRLYLPAAPRNKRNTFAIWSENRMCV
jgi:hypothetical protein